MWSLSDPLLLVRQRTAERRPSLGLYIPRHILKEAPTQRQKNTWFINALYQPNQRIVPDDATGPQDPSNTMGCAPEEVDR